MSEANLPTGALEEIEEDAIGLNPEGVLDEVPIKAGAQGRITDREIRQILVLYEKSRKRGYGIRQSYNWVALQTGRSPGSISNLIRELTPDVEVAKLKLRASAVKMVEKILDKAPTTELIDILSRPNMGVLAPIKQVQGVGGFFLNVTAESLGAVNINTGDIHGRPQLSTDTPNLIENQQGRGQSSEPSRTLPRNETAEQQDLQTAGAALHTADAGQREAVLEGRRDGEDHRAHQAQEESGQAAPERPRGIHGGLGQAGTGRTRAGQHRKGQLGLSGPHVPAQSRPLKRRHQKDGILDRSIHLDTKPEWEKDDE